MNQGKAYDVTSLLLVVGIGIAKSAMVVQDFRLDGGPFFLEAVDGERYVLAWNRCLGPILVQQYNQQPRIARLVAGAAIQPAAAYCPSGCSTADEALQLDKLFGPCSIPSVRRLLELGRGR